MGLARVYNDNVHPHTEVFKEKTISIAPKSFIEMDLEDAIEFKSNFTPIKTDGEKNPLPESFKMIRVVAIDKAETAMPLICHATGKIAANAAELAAMNAEHIDALEADSRKLVDEAAALKAENEALKAQLAAQTAPRARKGE
ncbi:MAG: hypothetical protein V4750_02730 [Pseudomonadota bacterium]